jgi:hypothetical protein
MATYTITLRTSADIRSLRAILKLLWRRYQLRCVSVEEEADRDPAVQAAGLGNETIF